MQYSNPFGHSGNEPVAMLLAKLANLTLGEFNYVFYTTADSTANAAAIRLVHYYNNLRGRPSKKWNISRLGACSWRRAGTTGRCGRFAGRMICCILLTNSGSALCLGSRYTSRELGALLQEILGVERSAALRATATTRNTHVVRTMKGMKLERAVVFRLRKVYTRRVRTKRDRKYDKTPLLTLNYRGRGRGEDPIYWTIRLEPTDFQALITEMMHTDRKATLQAIAAALSLAADE